MSKKRKHEFREAVLVEKLPEILKTGKPKTILAYRHIAILTWEVGR